MQNIIIKVIENSLIYLNLNFNIIYNYFYEKKRL